MKNVVVINSTPRKGGNSEVLAQKFAEGAAAAGHTVRIVNVRDLSLKFCIGCMTCQKKKCDCILSDGMGELYGVVQHADVLVFATPVYYYAVSGQLKTFLDRLNPLYVRDNAFKDIYLLATAAEDDGHAVDGCVSDINGWCACFDGAQVKGVLRGVGLEDRGDAEKTDYPAKAYEMGKSV